MNAQSPEPRARGEELERGGGWGSAPKVGWAGQRPWAMGEKGAGTARQGLRSCPFGGGSLGAGSRQDRDWVLEEEQGLRGQRQTGGTDSRTT